MKILKKIVCAVVIAILLFLLCGYFYFEQKFTPDENYLNVKNESGKISIVWLGSDKNVLLVPVKFSGSSQTYYMQFDTGSPYTLFYNESIKTLKTIDIRDKIAKTSFHIGNTTIISDRFKVINNGKASAKDSIKIIGTLGADILENNKTLINFRENYIVFNMYDEPIGFQNELFDFKFKKRKIIIEAQFRGKEEKFLYDSGTSAYELLINREVWADLKLPHSKVTIEKVQSWQNALTAYTAKCRDFIKLGHTKLPLNEVTYVKGFSQTQYMLMKYSGMTGLLGNKFFIKNCIYLDCSENKIGIQ